MPTYWRTWFSRLGVLALPVLAATGSVPASAHPHVFVAVETEVVYNEAGEIAGLKHRWHFDEMYSMFAVEGLDTNGDGAYSDDEFAALVKENVEGLKGYEYFTFAEVEGSKVEFADPPPGYKMERDAKGILTLNFFLPLRTPAKPGSLKFSFEVYDPEYYIAFAFAPDNPVRLAATAPKGCTVAVKAATASSDASADTSAETGASWGSTNSGTAVVACGG